MGTNQAACGCRRDNPTGPCTACGAEGSHRKYVDNADQGSDSNPSSSIPFTHGCEWIPKDNCLETDVYACGCRRDNPQGPCTPCSGNPLSSQKKAQRLYENITVPIAAARPVATNTLTYAVGGLITLAVSFAAWRRTSATNSRHVILNSEGVGADGMQTLVE